MKAEQLGSKKKKVLIWGVVERDLTRSFGELKPFHPSVSWRHNIENDYLSYVSSFRRSAFLEVGERFRYFLEYNRISFFFGSLVNSFLFDHFEKIDPHTSVYSKDPPFVFVWHLVDPTRVSSFYVNHSDSLVNHIADNIATVRDSLDSIFNTELILVPVPNKITTHKDVVTHTNYDEDPIPDHEYDDYLPKMYRALDERGVITIKLYKDFMDSSTLMYYPSDPHWNKRGMSVALDKAVDQLNGLGMVNY